MEALKTIMLIKPKTYNYIDYITRGSNLVYGFIAQQIKNILPNVVKIIKDYIPNIYCNGKLYILNNQLILKSSGKIINLSNYPENNKIKSIY